MTARYIELYERVGRRPRAESVARRQRGAAGAFNGLTAS
jgi:hypothetical protein